MGPYHYALTVCFLLVVIKKSRNFWPSPNFEGLVCVTLIIFEFCSTQSKYKILTIFTWSQAWSAASTKRGSNTEKNALQKAMSEQNNLIGNIKCNVVDLVFKCWIFPKVKLQKSDRWVKNVTGIGKLMWDEWSTMFLYMQKWPHIIVI